MPGSMTSRTPKLQFVNVRVPADRKLRHMIELQQIVTTAVHATTVAFGDHPLLTSGRVPLATRCIHRRAGRVMDQCPHETT